MTVAGLSVWVAGVVLELGSWRLGCQSMPSMDKERLAGQYRGVAEGSNGREQSQGWSDRGLR